MIGEACPRPTKEEYRLVAVHYTTDQAFDTSFTINHPRHQHIPNMPFTIIAGDKDTLAKLGMDAMAVQSIPELISTKPIYRPDLNQTRDNAKSQRVFLAPSPHSSRTELTSK